MIVRTSMQYQSVISAIPNINSNKNLSLMKNIFNENRYRLCVLIGGNCKKSFDGSISRFNWEQVHLYHYNDIAGMSPGFLAFSMIIFPFPLGIILGIYFLYLIFSRLKSVIHYRFKNPYLMSIILMLLLYPIINSFDLIFLPLSKGFLNLFLFFIFNNTLQNILILECKKDC